MPAGRGTLWDPRAASGPEELRDSERIYVYASTLAYLGTAGRGTREGTEGTVVGPSGTRGDRGLRAGRRSCVTWNGHTDVDVTQ